MFELDRILYMLVIGDVVIWFVVILLCVFVVIVVLI